MGLSRPSIEREEMGREAGMRRDPEPSGVGVRPAGRSPMPDLALLLDETNRLLAANGLPACRSVTPVADGDTANPNVIADARDRRYVVKVTQRHADTLNRQLEIANALRERTELPIPRHYCCAGAGDTLPLMVMEWLPGEQLRAVLGAAEGTALRKLCASLGACLAAFHDPNHLELVPEAAGTSSEWLHARAAEVLGAIARESRAGGAKAIDIAGVRRYLDARLPEMAAPAIPALEKADQDLRDFLAHPDASEITAMLDWERVTRGDGIVAVCLIFFRLWLNGKVAGWRDLLTAYNRLAAVPAEPCPQAEFFLMCRAVLALSVNPRASGLVELLLRGRCPPFE